MEISPVYHVLMSEWQDEAELHRIYQEARSYHNSYFEKLALLDGGTVALVITAVLGPLHGTIKHRYLLGVGLTFLVLAMLALLWRNFLAVQVEFHAAAITARDPAYAQSPTAREEKGKITKDIQHAEVAGLWLSAIGIVLLLIEVWFIIL
jgi:Ca2+/H+ antiporter